ncbi:TPA: hypothetical protein DEP94_01075 [Candidatus Nomurabacteria bacterium]|nr:hypothetical protein [Candidatus Nomurabacteria bacterium]
MSEKQVPSQWALREQVAACRFLPIRGVEETLQIFSADAQKFSAGVQAGMFKYMVLHAFRLTFSQAKVAAVCRGLEYLSHVAIDDVENLAKDIAFGRSGANEFDQILSEHYKIDDLVFQAEDKEVWFGNPPTQTSLIASPEPVKPKNAGPEAFQVGM